MKYLKYIFILSALLFLPNMAEAFSCTAVAGGGNWNEAGTWTSCNSTIPQIGDDVILDATSGNVVVNVTTATLKSLTMTGYTGTLSGSSQIGVIGATASTNNIIFDGTITWTGVLSISPTTATADINLTTNGKLMTAIVLAGSAGDVVLQDNLSFTASKLAYIQIASPLLNLNGKTISGNSATNRVILYSSAIGTQRTVTRSSGAFAYADFRDIDLEASYDATGITGEAGNCQGNSADFTFDASLTRYWIGGAGNWSDTAEWSTSSGGAGGASVPLCQDDVVFDNGSFSGASQTVDTDGMPRLGRSIDWSAYTEAQSPGWTLDNTSLSIGIYGSLNIANGGTSVIGTYSQGGTLHFNGRSSYTLMTGGESIGGILVGMVGGALTLQDALTATTLTTINGTFDANDFNVTIPTVTNNGSAVRTINMGSGTWTFSGTGTFWNTSASNLTLNEETSTILVTNTTATAKTFQGGGETYYNLTITGDDVTITGNNTFNVLALNNPTEAEGTIIGTGSTQTIGSLTTTASSGNVVLLSGVAGGSTETLSDSTGVNCVDYLTITNITVSGGASFYAGANSTDGTGNSGWSFTACPAGSFINTKIKGGVKINGGVKFR